MSLKTCKRRGWRRQWTVNAAHRQAVHTASALIVEFWGPQGRAVNGIATTRRLIMQHGTAAAEQMMRRLMREAQQVWEKQSVARVSPRE